MKKADNFDAKQWLVENKVTFQSRLNENTFYDDMVKANPGWDRETVMDMIKDEWIDDPEFSPGDFEDHQEYLKSNEELFDKLQSSGPTVKVGDEIEVWDRNDRKFVPGKIVKATTMTGNFMFNGNVLPKNIPSWEILDLKFGDKTFYPQYLEGEGFKKLK